MIKKLISILLIFYTSFAWSEVTDLYSLGNEKNLQRFQSLTHELRCLVCQNQALAESSAPLANDLRNQIAAMIRAGKSDPAILNFLTARYGDFILYRPPLNKNTSLLWFGPFIFLVLLFCSFILLMRRQIHKSDVVSEEQNY